MNKREREKKPRASDEAVYGGGGKKDVTREGKIKSGRQKRGTGGGLIERQTDDGGEGLRGTSEASPADGVGGRRSSSSPPSSPDTQSG